MSVETKKEIHDERNLHAMEPKLMPVVAMRSSIVFNFFSVWRIDVLSPVWSNLSRKIA